MPRTGRQREFDEERAIDALVDVFWQVGFEAASMQDLVDATGVQRSSLYATFGDKQRLYVLALARYRDAALAHIARLDDGREVLPVLRDILLDGIRNAEDHPGRGCFVGRAIGERLPGDEAAAELVREVLAVDEATIGHALARGQAAGELAADFDPAAQARHLLVVMHGLRLLAAAEPEPRRLDDAVDAALAGLRPVGADRA